ncbi:hypothetical protein NMY22_g1616 [Coprinellus aureogranulatus]|nr:hypothetical protein NMY22_g1616 [Coprinellus aureogranulatus]
MLVPSLHLKPVDPVRDQAPNYFNIVQNPIFVQNGPPSTRHSDVLGKLIPRGLHTTTTPFHRRQQHLSPSCLPSRSRLLRSFTSALSVPGTPNDRASPALAGLPSNLVLGHSRVRQIGRSDSETIVVTVAPHPPYVDEGPYDLLQGSTDDRAGEEWEEGAQEKPHRERAGRTWPTTDSDAYRREYRHTSGGRQEGR